MKNDSNGNGHHRQPTLEAAELGRLLEISNAERDAAVKSLVRLVTSLERLEMAISRIGGYMTSEEQAWLREARAELEEHGRRERKVIPMWRNRT